MHNTPPMEDRGVGAARQSARRRGAEAAPGDVSGAHGALIELPYLASASPAMARSLTQAREVAASDATVLLSGETGTGKEVIARHIHALSPRADGPFIAVNCGALPTQLVESELFGHERGAFSGAFERRVGHFEAAHGGTLLLDEVSEIPLALQTRLLRVLQEREVQRVGASRALPIDVRIIATTNRDLRAMVERGELRKDLFYRLNVFPIALPALRARKDDIVPLAQALLARMRAGPTRLTDDAVRALTAHDFPGNVRELENALERALVMSPDGVIDAELLALEPGPGGAYAALGLAPTDEPIPLAARRARSLDELERQVILETLSACNGNRTHASARLGISVRTMRNKLRSLREIGIAVPEPSPYAEMPRRHAQGERA